MYTDENHLWGLVAYYLAAGVLLSCCWHFRRIIPWRYPRHLLLLWAGVFLLLPMREVPELPFLAPAWFISLFEGLSGAPGGYARAGVPLLAGYLVAVVLYIPLIIYCNKRRNRKVAARTGSQEKTDAG